MIWYRRVLVLALVSTSFVACARPWEVAVVNQEVEAIGVRLLFDGERHAWILRPGQFALLVREPQRRAAILELFDPSDCATLAKGELPQGAGVLAIAHRGPMGSGAWQIDTGVETGLGDEVLEPNADTCP